LQAFDNQNQLKNDGPPRKKFSRIVIIFIILAVLGVGLVYDAYSSTFDNGSIQTSSTILTTNNIGSFCYGKTGSTETASQGTLSPMYIENLGLVFSQNMSEIDYNVSAVAQNDSYGIGPSYLVNGLTSSGLWYQAGVGWDLTNPTGGIYHGFTFVFEVWNGTTSIFPPQGGSGIEPFSTNVSSGDIVQIALSFQNGNVLMAAHNWNTSASANITYTAAGDSQFVAGPPGTENSEILMEWHLPAPYFCNNTGKVIFSNFDNPLSSAWMCISDNQVTNYGSSRIFEGCTPAASNFSANPSAFQSFQLGGLIEYSDAYEFEVM
jgi:hypothetical protein